MSGRLWTRAEVSVLRELYPDMTGAAMAYCLDRPIRSVYMKAAELGLRKSAEFLASDRSGRVRRGKEDPRMVGTRFGKGHEPWNKGASWDSGGRSSETRFKPGTMPHNHKPIGHERINVDGYRERKVAEPKTFRAVHVLLWEEHLGPVPKGFAVIFKNRDKTDIRIDNLALVSRADLMRRNSYHRYPQPIPQLIQLRGALNRQINRRQREEQDR